MKLLHISDLHFHRTEKKNKEQIDTLQFIAKTYPNHSLLLTGDITDDGHQKQYERASEALAPFKGRIFMCPGNHDFGAAGNFYDEKRAQLFDQYLSGPFELGGKFAGDNEPLVDVLSEERLVLIGLDSNLETDQMFDFACGEIGATQLKTLDRVLGDPSLAGMIKILYFHHHPFMRSAFMELKDAKELWRTVYKRVNVIAFGHKHAWEEWRDYNGVDWVLAADDAPGKHWAREIDVTNGKLTVQKVPINAKATSAP
jgi:predicted phosphodiesterase